MQEPITGVIRVSLDAFTERGHTKVTVETRVNDGFIESCGYESHCLLAEPEIAEIEALLHETIGGLRQLRHL